MMEDWIECRIDQAFKTVTGNTPSKKESGNYGSLVPFIKPPQISNKIIGDAYEYLSDKGKLKARILPPNSVLVTCIGNLGRVGINKVEVAFNQQINALLPVDFVIPKLMFYQCQSIKFRSQLEKLSTSTTVALVNKGSFNSVSISLPPLPIQRAIVSKIESLFSSLDNGIADLKKAQEQLKIYRQAVYASTLTWENLTPISDLVNNLSQGWSPKCINQNSSDPNQWAVIKTSAIQSGRFIEYENKILPETLEPREQHEIIKDDILITRAGPRVRVGICCLVKKTRPKLINCDKVYRLKLKKEKIIPQYFEYALNSPVALSKIEKMKTGSSDSGLNLTQKIFLKLEIPFPDLSEQKILIREIESRLSVCDKVEENIKNSLIKAKALRQSILKKAFEGKLLTAVEIEKCKQEADYEPASVLLERIKKEKKK